MALAQEVTTEGVRARITLVSWPATRLGPRYAEGERYRRVEGTIVRSGTDSLIIDPAKRNALEPSSWTVAYRNIYRLEVAGGQARSTKKGLTAGAVVGTILGLTFALFTHPGEGTEQTGEESPCGADTPPESAVRCGVIGLAIGALVGAVIGSANYHTVWVEVDKASLRVSDAPRYGLGLSVSQPH